ncbi:MAG: hypothetical protein EON93_02790 [Burkholderiales bacterium]|nr:MAG: hypothetical protein EON93_02790 [Burkholderiales bacterium]
MLLALTLAIVVPQTGPDPRAAERGCIIQALPPAQRIDLGERFIAGEMKNAQLIAAGSAAKCAATWKWSAQARDWQIVHSASFSAMSLLESQLPKLLNAKLLETLFGKLAPSDQYGLTLEGSAKLDADAYTAILRRVAALLADKLVEDDIEIAGNWFIAYAQFLESDAHLKTLAGGR